MSAPYGPIDLLAYDTDHVVVHARVELVGDRLADLLGAGGPVPAYEVITRDLSQPRTPQHYDPGPQVLDPSRLMIVVATGPRGSLRHRVDTVSRPVSLFVGRYRVHGLIHAPLSDDPMDHVHNRAWLPVTDAVLEHHGCGRAWRERFPTLLLNRAFARGLVSLSESAYEAHWMAGSLPVTWEPDLVEAG